MPAASVFRWGLRIVKTAVLGWGVFETSPRLRVRGLALTVAPPFFNTLAAAGSRPTVAAPTVAVSCGRGPNTPPLFPSGGPVAPPPLPRSLLSRPATVVGASGDRCPALRGSFVGYRLASFAGAFRVRSCVRRAGRVLRSGRAALRGPFGAPRSTLPELSPHSCPPSAASSLCSSAPPLLSARRAHCSTLDVLGLPPKPFRLRLHYDTPAPDRRGGRFMWEPSMRHLTSKTGA